MKKRYESIIANIYPASLCLLLLAVWQAVSSSGLVPGYLLPSPTRVISALLISAPELAGHTWITLFEGLSGLLIGVAAAFLIAVLMDRFIFFYRSVYPLLIISQTVPIVAIAPLLVLWMGYGIAPKITLVALMCFFPVAVGLLDGFKSADEDALTLLRAMGASRLQIYTHIKLPSSLGGFFAGLKISASYAVVGAVISEWLGGNEGLGVYMTRVRKSYAYDKMFAVIVLVSILSLVLIRLVKTIQKYSMPWEDN
ncbi:MAG: putative aliphatic sulfonates transport permease protein SsuC [Firmicutes bacterium ADurb.Bin193]|nr:MAG: putative aliphatic sulfonates transport permease protein SsuC [Firmicutes bacterium ADurb.Bin193]